MLKQYRVATAAGTALPNSTSETRLRVYSMPGYSLQAGKVYKVRGSVRATATNSTDTLRNRVRIGPTTLTGTAVVDSGAVDVADGDVFTFDVDIAVRSAAGSTSGSIVVVGNGSALGAAGTVTHRAAHAIVSSLDFTAALLIEVTGTWSVASASNSCQLESLNVYEISD